MKLLVAEERSIVVALSMTTAWVSASVRVIALWLIDYDLGLDLRLLGKG